ncbi:DNA polymerase III subunit gamma and tau [Halopolyspora algeriensis]|uniref:DNA polymerase III subunit gamma and tau n=1 Tax=Halopolyspora algeriensis TaxID=1500506 RepID=UPI000DF2B84B|nr:DNA polymerase III subunit gamma and tau [Halopolyspora algeriensis]
MTLALYRKYRPATFGEVVGQEHVTEPLRTALASGRINHAYLFSGPRGCGKTSSARILARSLNCLHGPTDEPCGECDSCVALAPEGPGSVDVIELDAASHGGVDDTRELRDRAVFAPAQSRYRIFVIDEAHMVTPQGFNALLKIVEEPPEHLVFVFATTEPDKVLTTIRSRTHHYPFRLMPPGTMRELLERICGEEGVRVEPAVYPLAIRAGGGSARDTLSIFDQLLAGAGAEGITYDRAVALLGVTDVALINDMVDALAAGDGAAVYGAVDRLVEAGHDPRRFASDLLDRLRDLVLLHAVPDAAQRGLVDSGGDDLTTMQSQSDRLGAATLSRFAEIVHNGLSQMRGATAPRLLLELMCARMLLPTVSEEETALLQRLERVERRMSIAPPESGPAEETAGSATSQGDASEPERPAEEPDGSPQRRVFRRPHERAEQQRQEQGAATSSASSAQAPSPARTQREPEATERVRPDQGSTAARQQPARAEQAEPAEDRTDSGSSGAGGWDAAAVRRVWTELLRAVAERNRPTQALLLNATVQDLRDGALVLSMPTTGLLKQFAQPHRIEFVRDAMRAVLGGEWQVQCVEAGAAPAQQGGQPTGSREGSAPAQAGPPRESPHGSSQGDSGSRQPRQQESRNGRATSTGGVREHRNPEEDRPAHPVARSTSEHDSIPLPPEPPDEEPPPEDGPEPQAPVQEQGGGAQDAEAMPAGAASRPSATPPPAADADPAGPDPGTAGADTGTSGAAEASHLDPQEVAVELLASELGARRIEET